MTEQKVTEQDRLERVRGMLSGTNTPEGVRRAMAQSPHGNVLLGAFLHGADRVRQGHEPTDLERLMLDAMGSVLSEAGTRAWGGVYREVADGGGTMAVVPRAFAQRPVSEGYSVEDLRKDLPDIVAEAMAAANTQIFDPRKPDRATDDPAFLAAMRATKIGVSAFAVPSDTFGFDSAAADGTTQTPGEAPDESQAAAARRTR
ncbi:hypothetical protein ACFWBC_01610 [Streptomyces sp. NPDC059985]|uniref:hypothetical protein n=1 Tax=Streptomyces sp. NPDC059985 TaxID=3347025 RepID=UPI0036BD170E